MNYENFTIKAQEALQESSSIANKNDNAEIAPEHLLLALLEQQDGLVVPVVERVGVNAIELSNKVRELVNSNPKVSGAAQVYFSSSLHNPFISPAIFYYKGLSNLTFTEPRSTRFSFRSTSPCS